MSCPFGLWFEIVEHELAIDVTAAHTLEGSIQLHVNCKSWNLDVNFYQKVSLTKREKRG